MEVLLKRFHGVFIFTFYSHFCHFPKVNEMEVSTSKTFAKIPETWCNQIGMSLILLSELCIALICPLTFLWNILKLLRWWKFVTIISFNAYFKSMSMANAGKGVLYQLLPHPKTPSFTTDIFNVHCSCNANIYLPYPSKVQV